jgi:hypothetical protein
MLWPPPPIPAPRTLLLFRPAASFPPAPPPTLPLLSRSSSASAMTSLRHLSRSWSSLSLVPVPAYLHSERCLDSVALEHTWLHPSTE